MNGTCLVTGLWGSGCNLKDFYTRNSMIGDSEYIIYIITPIHGVFIKGLSCKRII